MFPVLRIFACTLLCIPAAFISGSALSAGERALAVLSETTGGVELQRGNFKDSIQDGHFIYRNNVVLTGPEGKTTLLFRDGSRVRLYEQSRFLLQLDTAPKAPANRFKRRMRLYSGTMLVHSVPGSRQVEIQSGSGMLIRAGGGILRVFHRGNETGISLTQGEAWIRNRLSSVKLEAGQRLARVRDTDLLSKHVTAIPNVLSLRSHPDSLAFKDANQVSAVLAIQMQTRLKNRIVRRRGPVKLWSSYYRLRFPQDIKLDSSGNARVLLKIDPPDKLKGMFVGTILILASMDSAGFEQVAEGMLRLHVSMPNP